MKGNKEWWKERNRKKQEKGRRTLVGFKLTIPSFKSLFLALMPVMPTARVYPCGIMLNYYVVHRNCP